ncbi:hypothetical protein ABBQ38_014784 [Trebouxia sp. C0009 RCD-2024]
MACNVSTPACEVAPQTSDQPLSQPLQAASKDPEQEEPDAPWHARRQLRLYKTRVATASGVGRAWTGPWRTVPAAFAPDKYRLLAENPFAPPDSDEALTEPSFIKKTLTGSFY